MSGKPIVKKKKLSIEEKTAISLEKKLASDKIKTDARRLKRNPLNLPFVSRYGDFKEEKNEILARKAVNKVSKMKGNHILRPKLTQRHNLLFFNMGLVNKNPVEESETDLLPHNGNELEQHSSTSAYDTMTTADSCASTVLLSGLASQPELEPQSDIDHHLSTSFNYTMYYQNSCTNTLLSSCLEQMEMAASIHIEALQGERVTEQQPSSKKKDEAAEGEKAENLWKEKQEDVYKAFETSHASSAHGRMCSSDGCLNSLFDHHIRCDDCKSLSMA
ncbi:uncharacterized protein LOC116934522 [Daphnia magna]|uniref:uncharacterized protein LOC116934522 n=1 Tax=Daphnia magna TaxID=35525 RepID=UPI001E1BBBDD|nr:uncharacterized protein LOC116934522 [Daphnia magna]